MRGLPWGGELRTDGAGHCVLAGSFAPNGSSTPATASTYKGRGCLWVVTYTATGLYTVTLPSDLGRLSNAPLSVIATPEFNGADMANQWFECGVYANRLNTSTRDFVIVAHRAGTAREVAASSANRINFAVFANENTGA